MTPAWTWLALAGSGALHGLNPLAGWGLAAASGAGPCARVRALRALVPVALGHAAGMAVLAAGFATGLASLDAGTVRLAAGALLAFLALCHLPRRRAGSLLVRLRGPLRRVALAAWSFAMSIGHAAGLMLVPALVATCSSAHRFAGAGGPATIAALVGVHTLAMLATSGLLTLLGDRVARRFLDAGGERGTETRRRSD